MKPLPYNSALSAYRHIATIEVAYHDVVSQALPKVAATTVSPESDRAEQHLRPADDGVRLAYDAVHNDSVRTYATFVDMELEVDSESQLQSDRDEHDVGHGAVDPMEECASTM